MSTRATKSGINRETQLKMASKYDNELAQQCLVWIKSQINKSSPGLADFDTDGSPENFKAVLGDGKVLARFCNALKPGRVSEKKIEGAKMAFKKMELISIFMDFCKGEPYCVEDVNCFQTVDLFEGQNLHQVITCISALSRKIVNMGGDGFGPKESAENRRSFTQEQLDAGKNVIGLQMGTNKGANQAGMTFGKSRMIID